MKGYQPAMSFDEDVAFLDRDFKRGDENAAVAFLEKVAGSGPALELGIGTGRIALPLANQKIQVDGIDISPAMISQLRNKPGGDQLSVTLGDFSDVQPPGGPYRLIYVVFNTLFNLLTQEDQVRCFKNVATHLTNDGAFVIEAYVPSFLYRLRNNQYVDTEVIEINEVKLDVLRHDPSKQMIEESHLTISSAGVRLNPVVQRYAWPSELDLMAQMAGLSLKSRWGGWEGKSFDSESSIHVSVYRS
jgi:SAM-dependent methyltransferase